MEGFFEYRIEYYDAVEHGKRVIAGIIHAGPHYADAVKALEAYYGEECINNILWLKWLEDGDIIELGDGAVVGCEADETYFDYNSIRTIND